MKTEPRALLLIALIALTGVVTAFAGCGGEPPAVASLEFESGDIESGELPIGKDGSALVGVVARNEAGEEVEVDGSEFTWESEDGDVLEVRGLGTAALITGRIDWFDSYPADGGDPSTAHEPHTNLVVTYHPGGSDELRATIPVAVVLNGAGRWRAMIDGLGEQVLTLDQRGRHVSYSGTTGNASGTIVGNLFTLSQQGFMLTGTFTSRTEVSGTYTGPGGISGTWSATRE